ncbi:hypothetical protein L9F63_005898 [Diploptera punctata]|uniref:Cytochrome P450 n=1 Tax=Diploptera punctata TaxID=6984 RepID=A0AAD8E502_DIPPU|nr:hypothetical protein L9F63_005898 [Diploptera punctata]
MLGQVDVSLFLNAFVLSGFALVLLYVYFKLCYTYWKKRGVPTITPTVPFGNFARTLIVNNPSFQVTEYYKELEGERFGGLYSFHRPTLLLRDPELIKNILVKDFGNFYHRGFETDEENEPLQGHLFAISGPKWKNLRTKLTPTFTSGKIKMMFPTVVETGNELKEHLKKPAERNEVIEVKDILARYSTDIISSVAFGIQCNSLKNPNSEFRKWGRKIFEPTIRARIVNTLTFIAPLLPKIIKLGIFDPEMSKYFIQMVNDTVEYREKNNVHRNDFMQLLIQLKNKTLGETEADPLLKLPSEETKGLKSSAQFGNLKITMDVIAAQAFVFFGAGFETSSTTMTFCLYELALQPEIQDRVVSETLRKYPPLALLIRECTETTKLEGTDLIVEKGVQVLLPIMGLHRDPKYYPNPDKFDPERFNEEEKIKRHPFCYLPFGEGPRICIGMRFGLVQTKVGLISILSNYEVQVCDKTPIPLEFQHGSFVLASKGGIFLKITVAAFCIGFKTGRRVLILPGLALLAFYAYFNVVYSYWKKRGVKHPTPVAPFGNFAKGIFFSNPSNIVNNVYKELDGEKYGGLYSFNRPTLLLRDPELIKEVMVKDFGRFYGRGIITNEDIDPLQGHLFALSGSKWRNLRVKLTPTFTSGKMKMMFPTMVQTGKELQEYLKTPADKQEVLEIKDLLARYSTDIIASCAFGIKCNCLKEPNAEFRVWGRKIFQPSLKGRVLQFINFLIPSFTRTFNVHVFPKDVSKYFRSMVKDTVEYREANNIHRNDFMQLMIQLKNKTLGIEEDDPLIKYQVTMDVIAAQAFVFFAAGFETSSTTMTFCLYELACNPDIQARVRKEIDSMLKKHDGQVTYEGVLEMEYLDKVVNESLRKYPPVPLLTRECAQTTKLPGTDLVVDKGMQIMLPILGLQRDPKHFPDPDKFDPERFSEEEKNKRHPFSYIPFGEGPRLCIGMRFGLMQTKVGLISVLSNNEVQVSEKTPVPLVLDPKSFIMSPKGGMWLKIVKRSDMVDAA